MIEWRSLTKQSILTGINKTDTITAFNYPQTMIINPNLAVAILKRLSSFDYGIGEICANDFSISHEIFAAQIEAMFAVPLISSTKAGFDNIYNITALIKNGDSKITLSITDAGKQYLKTHDDDMNKE